MDPNREKMEFSYYVAEAMMTELLVPVSVKSAVINSNN